MSERPEMDRRNQPVPRWACLGVVVGIGGSLATSVWFAYVGARAAGADPYGWNIHLLFLKPAAVVIGLVVALIGGVAAMLLPGPRWIRIGLFVALVTLGSYWLGNCLFDLHK